MKELYDAVIIGAGPAGLTAGLYLARACVKVILLEKFQPGGQALLTDKIENYPGFPEPVAGPELMERMKKQAETFGLKIMDQEVTEVTRAGPAYLIKSTQSEYLSKAVLIATGAISRKLGVQGEERLTGRGVSYCATCDGPFFRGKEILVVGGGDRAIEEALFLTRFADKVNIIHRRGRLRAAKILQERAEKSPKINFILESVVTEILGEEKVEKVAAKNVKTGENFKIPSQGVFIFVGTEPHTSFLKGSIPLDEKGFIITDEFMQTSLPGIFACGDCRKKILRQVVTACSDGAVAAASAQTYIEHFGKTNI